MSEKSINSEQPKNIEKGEDKKGGISRRRFLKIAGALVAVGAITKLEKATGVTKGLGKEKGEKVLSGESVEFKVGDRIKEIYQINGVGINPEFDNETEGSAEDIMALVFVKACHKAWQRHHKDLETGFDEYVSMLDEAEKTGEYEQIMFTVGGADLTAGGDYDQMMINPLEGFDVVVADYIYDDMRMKMRIERQEASYRSSDKVMDEDVSPIEVKKDNVMLGYAKSEEGKLQLMFNLPSQAWAKDPTSSKHLTERLMISLIMLQSSPGEQMGHTISGEKQQEELNSKLERESDGYKKLMFVSDEIGILAAE